MLKVETRITEDSNSGKLLLEHVKLSTQHFVFPFISFKYTYTHIYIYPACKPKGKIVFTLALKVLYSLEKEMVRTGISVAGCLPEGQSELK